MLTPADDYPLHQRPEPIAFAGGDRNFYDRFFFNGYDAAGEVFFGVAFGVYPQLGIMDAAFSLRYADRQYNLRASKEMNGDRLNLQIGPISLTITRPMQETRIDITDNDWDFTATLTATALHPPIEEPRFTHRHATRLMMDYTRATQNIHWQGHICCAGQRFDAGQFCGTRDRSWGIRPLGARDSQPPLPLADPQFFWLWAPLHLEGGCFFIHTNDDGDGTPWNRHAQFIDNATGTHRHIAQIDFDLHYAPASRRLETLIANMPTDDYELQLVGLAAPFYMQGLGYLHPEWGHGTHHGALRTDFDMIDLTRAEAALAEGQLHNLHIQLPVQARLTTPKGAYVGYGALEQLILGRHTPSGFKGLNDVSDPSARD